MLDPFFPRGAFRRAVLFAASASLASCLGASAAWPGEGDCGPIEATQALIVRLGGHELTPLDVGREATLRMIMTSAPGTDQRDVLTDRLLASDMDDGRMAIVFVAEEHACGLVLFPKGTKAMLDALSRVGAADAL